MNSEHHELPPSIDLFLPPVVERRMDELVEAGEYNVRCEIIHEALWLMRNSGMTRAELRAELEAELQEALASGLGVEATPEFWRCLKEECRARSEWLKTQKLGNTLLPEKLHEFVTAKVVCGEFETPTHVVHAALRRLKAFADL